MKRSRSQATISIEAAPVKKRKSSKGSKYPSIKKFPVNGIASVGRAKLRYAQEISLTTVGTNATVRHHFAANSLYDPDVTGTGSQPVGFDEWMALYNLYTVVGGKVTCTPIASGTSSTAPQYFALSVSDSQILSSANSMSLLANCPTSNPGQPFSKWGINKGTTAIEEPHRSRSVGWTAGGIMGMPQQDATTRTSLQGTASSGPNDLIYITVYATEMANAIASSQPYLIQIEFDVLFTNPKQLLLS